MTAQTMLAIGGLTWTKVPFPTAAEELRAVADSLKNVVLIACPGTVAHALAYNGTFYSTDEVQIVEADTGAEPNMMLWLKAADPSGSGAIIDVSMMTEAISPCFVRLDPSQAIRHRFDLRGTLVKAISHKIREAINGRLQGTRGRTLNRGTADRTGGVRHAIPKLSSLFHCRG
jgi:hypothetical protein